jgi:Na+-driven multidrug efflux pump
MLVYVFRFGFVGSAISTALARTAMLAVLLYYVRRHPQYNR